MKKLNKLLLSLICFVAVFALSLSINNVNANAISATENNISFQVNGENSLDIKTLDIGDKFELDVMIQSSTEIGSIEGVLEFDKEVFALTNENIKNINTDFQDVACQVVDNGVKISLVTKDNCIAFENQTKLLTFEFTLKKYISEDKVFNYVEDTEKGHGLSNLEKSQISHTVKNFTLNYNEPNFTIKSIKIIGGSSKKEYIPTKSNEQTYDVTIDYCDINNRQLKIDMEDSTIDIIDNPLNSGENIESINITLRAYNGTNHVIVLNISNVPPKTNTEISNIVIKNGDENIDINFDKDTLNYEKSVFYNVDEIKFQIPVNEEKNTIKLNGTTYSQGTLVKQDLAVGENVFNFEVTAEDGVTKQTYVVKLVRNQADNVNTLADLSIVSNDKKLKTVFNEETLTYSLANPLPFDSKGVNFVASITPNHFINTELTYKIKNSETSQTVTASDLSALLNVVSGHIITYEIMVTAENGDVKTYNLELTAEASPNNNLKSLSVENYELNETFDKDTLVYNLAVKNNVESVNLFYKVDDLFSTILDVENQEAMICNLEEGLNTFTLKVQAQNNEIKTYTINISRMYSELSLGLNIIDTNEKTLTFTKTENVFTLNNSLPNSVKGILIYPQINETSTVKVAGSTINKDEYYSVIFTGVNQENKVIDIKVIGQDGEEKAYQLKITRNAPIDINTLSDLKINDTTIEGFDSDTLSYDLRFDNDVNSIEISATLSSDLGKIISGVGTTLLSNIGLNVNYIKVQSESGIIKTYTLNITKGNDNNKITNAYLEFFNFDEKFDPDVYEYNVTIPYSFTHTQLFIETEDESATVVGNGNIIVPQGLNTIVQFYAVSQIGVKGKVYTITIISTPANEDSSLKTLTVKDQNGTVLNLDKEFSPSIFDYKINLADYENITKINIEGEASNSLVKSINGLGTKTIMNVDDGLCNSVYEIVVVAENNTKSTYTISVIKEINLNDDTTLENLRIIGNDGVDYLGALNAETQYIKSTKNYSIVVPYNVNKISLTYVNSHGATLNGKTSYLLQYNTIENIKINLTSQSGKDGDFYYIDVIRTSPKKNNLLSSITLNGLKIDDFNPNQGSYLINISDTITTLSIDAVVQDETASIINGLGDQDLKHGSNKFTITTKAQDDSTKTYSLYVNVISEDNEVKTLDVDNFDFDSEFDLNTQEYNITVPYVTTYLNINATCNKYATLNGVGVVDLVVGENTFDVYATAENGVKGQVYKIKVNRTPACSDNSLKSLKIINSETDEEFKLNFDPNVLEYTIQVDNDLDLNYIDIKAEANSTLIKQIVGIGDNKALPALANGKYNHIFEIIVCAEDLSKRTYSVGLYREANLSDDTTITQMEFTSKGITYISLNETNTLEQFDPFKFNYIVNLPYSADDFNIMVTTTTASVTGEGAYNFDLTSDKTENGFTKVIKVIVVSQDAENKVEYTFTVNRNNPSTNNNLSSILINDKKLNYFDSNIDFDKEITEYSFTVGYENVTNLDVKATCEGNFAKVVSGIKNYELKAGLNVIKIIVVAENGDEKAYTLNIRRLRNDNTIQNIMVLNYNLNTNFNQKTYSYTLNVPYSESAVNISTMYTADTNVQIVGSGRKDLEIGLNTFEIYAISEAGTKGDVYTLYITRNEASTDNTLKSLKVIGNEDKMLSYHPDFNNTILSYDIEVEKSIDRIQIIAEATSGQARVIGVGNYNLVKGLNIFKISVISESGKDKIYTININEIENTNANLDKVDIDGKLYEVDNEEIVISVEGNKDSINLNAIAEISDGVRIIGAGIHELDSQETVIPINVMAEDNTIKQYTVRVVKSLKTDKTIQNILCNHGLFTKLNESQYSLNVDNKAEILDLVVNLKEKTSKYKIIGDTKLVEGKNVVLLSVTAEDGSNQIYQLIVNKKAPKSYTSYIVFSIIILVCILVIFALIFTKKKKTV